MDSSALHHEIWSVQAIVKMGNNFALYRPGCKHLNLQTGFTLPEKGFEVLVTKAGGWWKPIMISSKKNIALREREKKHHNGSFGRFRRPSILWRLAQQNCMTWSRVRDENAEKKTVKFYNAAAFSRTPKPDPPERLPHPVLFRGNDHRFPAATHPSYSATIHPVKSSRSMCADLTSTRKTSKGGEMPRFEEFQQYFLFCDWKPRGKGSWPLHFRKLRQFPNPKTKWGLVFLHWSWLKLV